METLKILSLGLVISAGLVMAQAPTQPAADSTKATASKTTKDKNKAKTPSTTAASAASATRSGANATQAPLSAASTPEAPTPPPKAGLATAKSAPPTTSDIANAKAKGLVWVNLNKKVYHASSAKEYGTTKDGLFMTEPEAKAAGAKAAKN